MILLINIKWTDTLFRLNPSIILDVHVTESRNHIFIHQHRRPLISTAGRYSLLFFTLPAHAQQTDGMSTTTTTLPRMIKHLTLRSRSRSIIVVLVTSMCCRHRKHTPEILNLLPYERPDCALSTYWYRSHDCIIRSRHIQWVRSELGCLVVVEFLLRGLIKKVGMGGCLEFKKVNVSFLLERFALGCRLTCMLAYLFVTFIINFFQLLEFLFFVVYFIFSLFKVGRGE